MFRIFSNSLVFLVAVAFWMIFALPATGAIVTFSANPATNSIDWAAWITNHGGVINSNVNFNTHPLGHLQSDFYQASDGVTLTRSVPLDIYVFSGAGPSGSNTTVTPKSTGEGIHPSSNYLNDNTTPSTLTISFASPVLGAGLYLIDVFNPYTAYPSPVLMAYSGPDGTGTLLGSATAVNFNFQRNYLYFLGLASDQVDIRSLVLQTSSTIDVIGIDDIRFAAAPVPLPPSVLLLGSGLLGLPALGFRRRRD